MASRSACMQHADSFAWEWIADRLPKAVMYELDHRRAAIIYSSAFAIKWTSFTRSYFFFFLVESLRILPHDNAGEDQSFNTAVLL